MSRDRILAIALATLLLIGAGSGFRAWRQLREGQRARRTCEQVEAEEFQGAARTSDGLLAAMGDGDPMLPEAARCRCTALMALEQRDVCVAEADALQARQGWGWVQDPTLALILAGGLLAEDRAADALAVLQNAEPQEPGNLLLLTGELAALSQKGDAAGMRQLSARVAALPPDRTTELRIDLGHALAALGETDAALAAMEPGPPTGDPKLRDWYNSRAFLLGSAGRREDLAKSYQRWEAEGGRPGELYLYYTVISDITHQPDGFMAPEVELREAIDGAPADVGPEMLALAWWRLIANYLNASRADLALAAYDEATARGITVPSVNREDLRGAQPETSGGGLIRFHVAVALDGDVLKVSPPPDSPADAVFEEIPLRGPGPISAQRAASGLPVRWVLEDGLGQAVNSGAVVLDGSAGVAVEIAERKPVLPVPPFALKQAPGDGRRRVFVIVIDCGDWHLERLLDARGELPVLHALESAGLSGVTTSVPAFTGVAMEKIAHPQLHRGETFLGFLHHLGMEAAGFESVGTNPLEGLSWVLPESPYLVDIVGATNRVAANLLFAVGDIDAGRDMMVVGPAGKTEELTVRRQRPLTEAEIAALPGLGRPPTGDDHRYLEGLAAQLDLTADLAAKGRLDLLLLRLAQTDLMTHAEFSNVNRTGTDNADNILLWTYRYVDWRLGEVANALDQDDVLIVMSDHGIQTSMLHSPQAMFVMIGGAKGHLSGAPEIAGIPRLLSDLLNIPPVAGWPDTGLSAAAVSSAPPVERP